MNNFEQNERAPPQHVPHLNRDQEAVDYTVKVLIPNDPFSHLRPWGLEIGCRHDLTPNGLRKTLSKQPGKPLPESLRLISGGRPISSDRGDEPLRDVLNQLNGGTPSDSYNVHCVVLSWTEKPPAPPSETSEQATGGSSTKAMSSVSDDADDLAQPWKDINQDLAELKTKDLHDFLNHLRRLNVYLWLRLQTELSDLGPPFSDIRLPPIPAGVFKHRDQPPPVFTQDHPAVEAACKDLVRDLDLSNILESFTSSAVIRRDYAKIKSLDLQSDPQGVAKVLGQLERMRYHQGLLSICMSIIDLPLTYTYRQNRDRTSTPFDQYVFAAEPALSDHRHSPDAFDSFLYDSETPRTLEEIIAARRRPGRPIQMPPGTGLPPQVQQFLNQQAAFPRVQPGQHPLNRPFPRPDQQPLVAGAAAPGGAIPDAPGPLPPAPPPVAAPAANALAIVINFDELRQTIVPILWLSFKLFSLLYIFARRAPPSKQIALCVIAFFIVVWEGWSIRTRRVAAARRLAHQAFARQRDAVERNLAEWHRLQFQDTPQGRNGQGNGDAAGQQQQAARQPPQAPGAPQLRPGVLVQRGHGRRGAWTPNGGSSSSRRRNPWTTSYWISKMAGVGLSEEARETGLRALVHRRDNPNYVAIAEQQAIMFESGRWIRRARIGLVLFLGSLIPEVERKRRRALEKRERVLRDLRAEVERNAHEATAHQEAPAGSGPTDAAQAAPAEDEANNAGESSRADANVARITSSLLENSRANTPDPVQPPAEEVGEQAPADANEPEAAARFEIADNAAHGEPAEPVDDEGFFINEPIHPPADDTSADHHLRRRTTPTDARASDENHELPAESTAHILDTPPQHAQQDPAQGMPDPNVARFEEEADAIESEQRALLAEPDDDEEQHREGDEVDVLLM